MKYPKRSQYKHAKSQYRVRNWPEYEAGLQKRGDLTVWLSDESLDSWRAPASGKPGGQRTYANIAIEAALTTWTGTWDRMARSCTAACPIRSASRSSTCSARIGECFVTSRNSPYLRSPGRLHSYPCGASSTTANSHLRGRTAIA